VRRVETLGDDALEPEPCDASDELLGSLHDDARRRSPPVPVEHELIQQRPTVPVRQRASRPTVEMQDVEHLQHDRLAVPSAAREPLAEPREVGSPIVAQAH
jgi:hypothetical protein